MPAWWSGFADLATSPMTSRTRRFSCSLPCRCPASIPPARLHDGLASRRCSCTLASTLRRLCVWVRTQCHPGRRDSGPRQLRQRLHGSDLYRPLPGIRNDNPSPRRGLPSTSAEAAAAGCGWRRRSRQGGSLQPLHLRLSARWERGLRGLGVGAPRHRTFLAGYSRVTREGDEVPRIPPKVVPLRGGNRYQHVHTREVWNRHNTVPTRATWPASSTGSSSATRRTGRIITAPTQSPYARTSSGRRATRAAVSIATTSACWAGTADLAIAMAPAHGGLRMRRGDRPGPGQ